VGNVTGRRDGGDATTRPTADATAREPLETLELRGITKRFPGVLANDNVNLTVRTGEILCLLGENGAGKSTLMNILYGLYSADEGEILINGERRDLTSPSDAIAAGIGMVHQHFMLVPVFTVAENVVLGVEPTNRAGVIDIAEARNDVRSISAQYKLEVDPDAIIEDLPVGIQQRVEIIKVLFRDAEILVFDEPTAVLTPQEVIEFFTIVRQLKEDGKGIIFITHKLKEVLEIADRIAVLRRGAVVGEADPATATESELAEMMVGRPVELTVTKAPSEAGEAVLDVRDLRVLNVHGRVAVKDVSFQVRKGEIVGIAGVQGNGQTELVEALTGLREVDSGTVLVSGADVTNASPREMHKASVAHVPEDRQRSGLVLGFTLTENFVLDSYYDEPFSHGIRMDWDRSRKEAVRLVEQFDVRTPSTEVLVANLSGGNQQKVIVAREFGRTVDLVIASQPTRGIDVGSIEFIHERIVQERDQGAAVLIVSTELDEVMALSDRILVMFAGRIVAEKRPEETTTAELGLYMAGATIES
jgi:general nucleoside transport system ATP-binding protein